VLVAAALLAGCGSADDLVRAATLRTIPPPAFAAGSLQPDLR
jgi:hypothetical protein